MEVKALQELPPAALPVPHLWTMISLVTTPYGQVLLQ